MRISGCSSNCLFDTRFVSPKYDMFASRRCWSSLLKQFEVMFACRTTWNVRVCYTCFCIWLPSYLLLITSKWLDLTLIITTIWQWNSQMVCRKIMTSCCLSQTTRAGSSCGNFCVWTIIPFFTTLQLLFSLLRQLHKGQQNARQT